MRGWDDIEFIHVLLVPYLTPPDVVCLVLTSREGKQVFDTADSWRAVTQACFGQRGGSRGHLSRKLRRRKVAWRAGDGAKARLCLLYHERTLEKIAQLRKAHVATQLYHERRWVLKQSAAAMQTCTYASRKGSECSHDKLRLWTSVTVVASRPSSRGTEQPLTHAGVRCDRCKSGPIRGSCFRCAAGCRGAQQPRPVVRREFAGTVKDTFSEGCYTLCEKCFSERHRFHPPHPFARLGACFADARLSGPVLYEAVCGDCLFGSLVLVRPIKMREVVVGKCTGVGRAGNPDIWAVPIRVEASGPLPLYQVRSRIAAGDRDDNRGLAFASEKWRPQEALLDKACSP